MMSVSPKADDFVSTAPTLMVGLGGLGCYTVATLYSQLSKEQKRYVQAIILDTDVNELREPLYDELRNTNSTIQTSRQGTVQECISQLNMPSIAKWFNQNGLEYKQMTDGAAQVRSISRLAMLDTINSNRIDRLNTKLNQLLDVKNRDGNLAEACRIIIVNSVAGGTGSGSFLQLSLYIQEYFKQRNITNVSVRSFTIMPDVFIENGDYASDSLKNNVRANGYAALKEIDACMSVRIGKYADGNVQGAPFYPMSLELKTNKEEAIPKGTPPFDVVTLFDYVNTKGENLGHKNNYVSNMMDVIRLHLFSPLVGKGGIASQTDNLANHNLKHGDRSRYASAGVANLEYPVADMVKYAALRWATDGISKNWLEIDEQINDETNKIIKQRKEGINRDIPNPNERFAQILREKCEIDKPSIFYRNVYNDLFLLNEYGERSDAKHELWLKKIADLISQTAKAIVQEKVSVLPILNQEGLQDPASVESQVRQSELGLERYQRELVARVQSSGLTIANNAMWSPYRSQVRATNNESELNYWLIPPKADDASSKAMHPLAMRYFLSEVSNILSARLTKTQSDKNKLEKQIENYVHAYDNPKTEVKETAVDIARENTKLFNRLRGNLKAFAEEYIARSQAQKASIEKLAQLIVAEECYETLLGYVEDLANTWQAWFGELENVVTTNQRQIAELSTLHENRLNPTTIYVLASQKIKEALWEEESIRLASGDFPPDIAEQIYLSIYHDKGRTYVDHLPPKPRLNWAEKEFNNSVLSWCTKKIYESGFNIDVGRAVIKELEINQKLGIEAIGTSIEEKLKSYMTQLTMLANPLVNLNNENAGENFTFTCMHPESKQAFGDTQIAQSIGSPFVKTGFSKYKITQLNLKYGLLSTDLRTLNIDGGLYRQAYEDRIAESRQIPRKSTSPHLDERWNSPAYLPEIDDNAQIQAIKRIYQACIVNQAYHHDNELQPAVYALTQDMQSLWHWSRGGQQDTPVPSLDGLYAHATLYNLVDVFSTNFVLVGEILDGEQTRLHQKNLKPEDSPVIKHAKALLASIESITHNPPNLATASERQQQLVYAIFEYIKDLLSAKYPPNTANAIFKEITNTLQAELADLTLSDDYQTLVQHIIKKCMV